MTSLCNENTIKKYLEILLVAYNYVILFEEDTASCNLIGS